MDMSARKRLSCGLLLMAALLGCDSMELTIGVEPGPDGTLEVSNANDTTWIDAVLVVETVDEGHITLCAEKRVAAWQPADTIRIPTCGEKIRLTLTTQGETARFAYANGQLYRRFGRKEVPVAP
jgi:hypothetical protein